MKILFVSTTYSNKIGGRESVLYKISQELAKDNEVQVIARFDKPVSYFESTKRFSASFHTKSYICNSVKVNIIGLNFWEKILLLLIYRLHFFPETQYLAVWLHNKVWLRKIITFVKWADLVEFHGTGFELLGFSFATACETMGKPFIISPHMHPGTWGDGKIDISLYKKADAIIAKTNYEKQFLLLKGLKAEKIKVIHNAPFLSKKYNADLFRKKYTINRNTILFVGRKTKDKGYNALVEAIDLVWQEKENTFFVFIGQGKCITKTDFRIIELAWMDEFEKASAYSACDIFCMPSYAEAFGIVYTEAWTFAKPVIGGDIPALREVISDGIDGLLVKQSPPAIAKAILKLLADDKLRYAMGQEGKKKVAKYFNWDSIISEIKALYNSVAREFISRN